MPACIALERGEGRGLRPYQELVLVFLWEEQWREVTLQNSTGANHCEGNVGETGWAIQEQVCVPLGCMTVMHKEVNMWRSHVCTGEQSDKYTYHRTTGVYPWERDDQLLDDLCISVLRGVTNCGTTCVSSWRGKARKGSQLGK